jgi:hypothetical protein
MAVERLVVADRTAFLRRPDYRVVRVLALLGLVVLCELVTRTGWVSALFLPAPSGVLAEGLDMARSGQLLVHLTTSLERSSRWPTRWCSRSSPPPSRSRRSPCCRS